MLLLLPRAGRPHMAGESWSRSRGGPPSCAQTGHTRGHLGYTMTQASGSSLGRLWGVGATVSSGEGGWGV